MRDRFAPVKNRGEQGPAQEGMDPFGKGEEINEEHERHQDENGVAKDVDGVGDGGSCDVSHADPVIVKGGLEFAAAGRGHVVLGELPVEVAQTHTPTPMARLRTQLTIAEVRGGMPRRTSPPWSGRYGSERCHARAIFKADMKMMTISAVMYKGTE